jgi:hypothetical protein
MMMRPHTFLASGRTSCKDSPICPYTAKHGTDHEISGMTEGAVLEMIALDGGHRQSKTGEEPDGSRNRRAKGRRIDADVEFGPKNDLERHAVECLREPELAELELVPGTKFGQAMIDLRESLDHGDWMPTLERLGITYRKAQYWIDVVRGKHQIPGGPMPRPNMKPARQAAQLGTDQMDEAALAEYLEDCQCGAIGEHSPHRDIGGCP